MWGFQVLGWEGECLLKEDNIFLQQYNRKKIELQLYLKRKVFYVFLFKDQRKTLVKIPD